MSNYKDLRYISAKQLQEVADGYKTKIKFYCPDSEIKSIGDIIYKCLVDRAGSRYDKGGEQCRQGTSRSDIDMYRLIKYYFPKSKVTIASLREALSAIRATVTQCYVVRKNVYNFYAGNAYLVKPTINNILK